MNSQNGWNTASGDKYIIYNKQEENEKQFGLAMYSEKYIRNLNIYMPTCRAFTDWQEQQS